METHASKPEVTTSGANAPSISERFARSIGAALAGGLFGYVMATLATDEMPFAIFVVMTSVCPVVAIVASLPRLSLASYAGKGLLATIGYAFGYAASLDYSVANSSSEATPGLTFIAGFVVAIAWFIVVCLPVIVAGLMTRKEDS